MAIGPTIENLRRMQAEQAAARQMLIAAQGDVQTPPRADVPMSSTAAPRQKSIGQRLTGLLGEIPNMLNGTDIPERLAIANELFNPVAGIYGAMDASGQMLAPDRTGYERASSLAEMLTGMAGAALPAVSGLRGINSGSNAVMETFLGAAPRRSVPSVGQAAADAYRVGDRLSAPSSYRGPQGRPSTFSIPDDGMYDARPISQIEQATREYLDARGMDSSPLQKYAPVNEDRAGLIASAYDMMGNTPNDPATRRAYDAMIQETLDQYNSLRDKGIEFKFLKEGMSDPYSKSPAMGYKDLVENGRLFVYPTDFGFGSNAAFDPSTNPLLRGVGRIGDKSNAVANDAFRAVHDTFGHFGSGNPFFRAAGEERAWQEHARMYSPEARGAMTSETRGQNSWLNYGPYGPQNRTAKTEDTIFADQKAGLLSPWAYDVYGMPDPDELEYLRKNMAGWQR
jgi:hypothetical protein